MTNEEKRKLVLEGSLYKGLIILSFPIIFNNLMQTMYNLSDSFWVSKISINNPIYVAAVSGVWPITALIVALGAGLQIAGTSLMSQHIGGSNKKQADFIASQLFSFSFILGISMMIIGFITTPFILKHVMGLEGETLRLSLVYINILFIATPIDFCLMIFTSMRQSYGDTITPVVFTITSVILNMVLDPLFIIIFKMGVEGAALATVLAKVIVLPIWLYLSFFDKKSIYVSVKQMKWQLQSIVLISSIALSASIGQVINSVGFIVLNRFIFSYGDATMAAFSIGNRINNLIMMPAMGFGTALAFYVGQNIGSENFLRAKLAFKASLTLTLIMMIIGMFIILPYQVRLFIINIFFKDNETVSLGVEYLLIVGFNTPLMGIYQNLTGVFQGSGKTFYSLAMSIFRLWIIRIPIMYLFKYFTHLEQSGIWYAMVISNVFICIIGALLYFYGNWQKKLV